jgi:hypothetical protein
MVSYAIDKAKQVLRFYRDYTSTAPDELSANAMLLTLPGSDPIVGISLCYAGLIEAGERVLKPLKAFGPPALDLIRPMAYAELQTLQDAMVPYGTRNYYSDGTFLKSLSDEALDTIVALATARTSKRSLMSLVLLEHFHGAANRVGQDETAFVYRNQKYMLEIISSWLGSAESDEHIRWTREFLTATQPFSTGEVYVNYLGEEGEDRIKAAYGANYKRLVAVKNKYDPTNFFRMNHNIKPTL